jgi:NAD(P)-dependent dehydrogenase (short-subunit alcohol dehydrogenase family)
MALESQFAHYPSLKDRAVLVSGGASGIGAAIVSALAHQGARLCFVDIAEEAAELLIEDIKVGGRGMFPFSSMPTLPMLTLILPLYARSMRSLAGSMCWSTTRQMMHAIR